MKELMGQKLRVVVGLTDDRRAVVDEVSVDELLTVLFRRADRLVEDSGTREKLRPVLREFVRGVVEYFNDSGELDEYLMINIMTALATADNHGPANDGVEDYATFVRRLNPTDPDEGRYFVIGRVGRISDPDCPMAELERKGTGLAHVPAAQLHMFQAYYYARSRDATRGAPRIPAEDFVRLLPAELRSDPALEEAFLDVCFSDGAWALYQRKFAA